MVTTENSSAPELVAQPVTNEVPITPAELPPASNSYASNYIISLKTLLNPELLHLHTGEGFVHTCQTIDKKQELDTECKGGASSVQ